jgi:hypothetical protein
LSAKAADIAVDQALTVDDVWLTGDILMIAVTDNESGKSQTLELTLSDYAQPGDEYVTIQATDSNGRLSNAFQFKNPYYSPTDLSDGSMRPDGDEPEYESGDYDPALDIPVPTVPDETNPFTPDGTGTVIDNAKESDGKEFFTVKTPNNNVFYLVFDRQRTQDNVYLLNTVTEQDLMALADISSGSMENDPTVPPIIPDPEPQPQVEPAKPEQPPKKDGGNNSMILIIITVVAVGGAGYYFKIVRPKKNGAADDEDFDDEQEDFDDDTEVEVEDEENLKEDNDE